MIGSPAIHGNVMCQQPQSLGFLHFFRSLSTLISLFFYSICDVYSGPYLICSSSSMSMSRQVASGAMLEPARHTPLIYLPSATQRMATCLWMVAMLTMSQVRFQTVTHQNLSIQKSPVDHLATLFFFLSVTSQPLVTNTR